MAKDCKKTRIVKKQTNKQTNKNKTKQNKKLFQFSLLYPSVEIQNCWKAVCRGGIRFSRHSLDWQVTQIFTRQIREKIAKIMSLLSICTVCTLSVLGLLKK
jgi:hypothetical protein